MKDIVIIGAGGHAKVILDILVKRKELLNECLMKQIQWLN